MAMVKCKECREVISSKAGACPKCGAPLKKQTSGCAWIVAVVMAFFLWGVVRTAMDRPTQGAGGKSGAPRAGITSGPPEITLLSFDCRVNSIDFVEVVGEVRNSSGRKLNKVWVLASFYDGSKSLVDSGSTVADIHPLLPGQKSAFKLLGPRNPAVKSCDVTGFKENIVFGDQLTWDKVK